MSDRREDEEPAVEPQAEVPVDPNAGKTVIVAGSPEHEALLQQYPNASSYGPDVVVVPAPEPPVVTPEEVAEEEPPVQREGESDYDFDLRRQAYEDQRRGR